MEPKKITPQMAWNRRKKKEAEEKRAAWYASKHGKQRTVQLDNENWDHAKHQAGMLKISISEFLRRLLENDRQSIKGTPMKKNVLEEMRATIESLRGMAFNEDGSVKHIEWYDRYTKAVQELAKFEVANVTREEDFDFKPEKVHFLRAALNNARNALNVKDRNEALLAAEKLLENDKNDEDGEGIAALLGLK